MKQDLLTNTYFAKYKAAPDSKTYKIISIDFKEKKVILSDGYGTFHGEFRGIEIVNSIETALLTKMKTPGQIAFEANYDNKDFAGVEWTLDSQCRPHWEKIAQAVLSSQWRSVDDPPKDKDGGVILGGGDVEPAFYSFAERRGYRTHWMSVPDLPKPKELTPEKKALKEFKEKFEGKYDLTELNTGRTQAFKFNATENAWEGFKAGKGLK